MAKRGTSTAVPRLRFPEFGKEQAWDIKPFSQILTIGSGKDYKHLDGGPIPMYGSGGYMLSVSDYLYDGESACIGRKGTINKPIFLSGKFWTVDTLFYTHSFKGCLPRFVFLHFQQIDWLKHNEAGGIPSLSKSNIEKIEVAVPGLKEQQKIADCLTSLDEVITTQGRKVEALKAHKRGLMQQLFPRIGETRPRLRFPEFASTSAWHCQKISSLLSKASYSVSVEPDSTYREIGIRSHGKGVFYKEPVLGQVIGDKRVFHVVQDALILNIVFAWEQAVATTSKSEVGMIASHRFPMYVAKPDKCDVRYVKDFFLTQTGKLLLGVASPGGAGRNKTLGQKEFENLEIPLPIAVGEQQRIADCLSSLDTQIAAESNQLTALKTHKQGLMQQLFPAPEAVTA